MVCGGNGNAAKQGKLPQPIDFADIARKRGQEDRVSLFFAAAVNVFKNDKRFGCLATLQKTQMQRNAISEAGNS